MVDWDAMGGHWGANRRLVVHFRPLVDSLNRCISFYKLDCQNWRRTCALPHKLFVLQKQQKCSFWFHRLKKDPILSPRLNRISYICLSCKPRQNGSFFLGNLTGKYDAIQQPGEIDNGELRKYGKLNPGEI